MAEVTGGKKFAAAMREIANKLSEPVELKVGFFADATYPDGQFVAEIAAIQNYGAPSKNIPPRPFFSNMVADKSPEWPKQVAKALSASKYDVERALDLVGEGIVGQLQQSIDETNTPPLAEATIRAKGFDKPLIDSGRMRASANKRVTKS